MADTCECLASETVGANGCQILKCLEFRGGETFAKNREIIPLIKRTLERCYRRESNEYIGIEEYIH